MLMKTASKLQKKLIPLVIILLSLSLILVTLTACDIFGSNRSPSHTHSYGEWEVVTQPNCSSTGKKIRTCISCGETNEEVLPTNSDHDYEESIVTKATGTASGMKKFTCKRCDASYTEDYTATKLSAEEIYDIAEKIVVEITTYDKKGDADSLGSGFIYSTDGKIVTNFHVIDDAYSIKISLGTKKYNVTHVLAYDEEIDLAILKVDTTFNACADLN